MNKPTPASPAPDPLLLIVIETKKSGTFIKSSSFKGDYQYQLLDLRRLLFDGVPPEPTSVSGWSKVASIPKVITKVVPGIARTVAFVLSPGFAPSERMPARISGESSLVDTPYEGVCECYTAVIETSPSYIETVPFQLHVIAERDTFEIVRSDFTLTYGLIDQLTIADPILLQERPCKLDGRQSYNLIRAHVKNHIDPKRAEITSDYDFCFTVQKRVRLAVPEPTKRTVGKGKRAYEVVDYRQDRNVKVYEVAPPDPQTGKPYGGYPLVEPFMGTSHEDLKAKIAAFLDDLMRHINEPLCECKACGGRGVIIEAVLPVIPKP